MPMRFDVCRLLSLLANAAAGGEQPSTLQLEEWVCKLRRRLPACCRSQLGTASAALPRSAEFSAGRCKMCPAPILFHFCESCQNKSRLLLKIEGPPPLVSCVSGADVIIQENHQCSDVSDFMPLLPNELQFVRASEAADRSWAPYYSYMWTVYAPNSSTVNALVNQLVLENR